MIDQHFRAVEVPILRWVHPSPEKADYRDVAFCSVLAWATFR